MKSFAFKKIDAFTRGTSRGNPAACVYLRRYSDIAADEMQRIARELKGFVSEVVYVFPEGDGFFLKYYSSECEVDFCGHGTIAAMYDSIKSDAAFAGRAEVPIRVGAGTLRVINRISDEDSVYIEAPAPARSGNIPGRAAIADALDIPESVIDPRLQPDLINAGLNTLLVPVAGLEDCLRISPDAEKLRRFCRDAGADIALVFTGETAVRGSGFRTRVFAPKYGYLEDPATGSGNSALGYYLLDNGLWDGGPLSLEQSADRDNPNIVRLASFVDRDGARRVVFGGGAAVRITGEYVLG